MSTRMQEKMMDRIKKVICSSVESQEASKGALSVSTPFLGWDGSPVRVYLTEEGRLTDGGGTISLLRSLNVDATFEAWPFLRDYLDRYCIEFDGRRMSLHDTGNDVCYLRFIQGISRLPNFFEPKPITDVEARFPRIVRMGIVDEIKVIYKDNLDIGTEMGSQFIQEKEIALRLRRRKVVSDLSANRRKRMIQLVSHAASQAREQESHVAYKVHGPMLLKKDDKSADAYAVVSDLTKYTDDSVDMLNDGMDRTLEWDKSKDRNELMKLLIEE